MSEWLTNPVFTTWDTNTSLWSNTLITLYMTVGTMLFTALIGVPLGVLLYETERSTSRAALRGPTTLTEPVGGSLSSPRARSVVMPPAPRPRDRRGTAAAPPG